MRQSAPPRGTRPKTMRCDSGTAWPPLAMSGNRRKRPTSGNPVFPASWTTSRPMPRNVRILRQSGKQRSLQASPLYSLDGFRPSPDIRDRVLAGSRHSAVFSPVAPRRSERFDRALDLLDSRRPSGHVQDLPRRAGVRQNVAAEPPPGQPRRRSAVHRH